MKFKYKKYFLFIISAIFTSSCVLSCGNNSTNDSDYDGLMDKIDPNPRSNKYNVSLLLDEKSQSKPFELEVDYREYIKEGYNKDLSLLSAILINEVDSIHGTFGSRPIFLNDVYKPSLETLMPTLSQIGGENIESIKLDFSEDPYDVATLYFANHTFIDGEITYQFFFTAVDGYINGNEQWVSNLDIGAWDETNNKIVDGYDDFWDRKPHSDWVHHNNHKGFDVTAVRCKREIEDYIKKYEKEDTHKILVITGQSRAAAISNLVAKEFIDDGVDTRAYCFNPPAVTKDSDCNNEKYKNIFVLNNTNDIVSRVPCPNKWGFKRYGTVYDIDIADEGNKLFKNYFYDDYYGFSNALLDVFEAQLSDLCITEGGDPKDSDGIYKPHYKDTLGIYDYEVYSDSSDAERFTYFIRDKYNGLVTYELKNNQDGTFTVTWQSKGCLLIRSLEYFLVKGEELKEGHFLLLKRLLFELFDGILKVESLEHFADKLLCSHGQKTALILAMRASNI